MGIGRRSRIIGGGLLLLLASACQSGKQDYKDPLERYISSGESFLKLSKGRQKRVIRFVIDSMTLEEKIGQLFILPIRHTSEGRPALTMDSYLSSYMERYKPGGLIFFSLNYRNPEQIRGFIKDLQGLSNYPLFISTDEEGGAVRRLSAVDSMEVFSLPPAKEIASWGDPGLMEEAAYVQGMDMAALGLNLNMAPVADVSRGGPKDAIGNRSFGSDPNVVALFTVAGVQGLRNSGIEPTLKHFPGHGNVYGDSHNGAVQAQSTKEEFYSIDFTPFKKGIQAGVGFIMIAHVGAKALTGDYTPASLSYTIQTEILRGRLKYEGLIITDAMDMGAINTIYPSGEATLKAFLAGVDIILMPQDIGAAYQALTESYHKGEITEERLEASLNRIIRKKMEMDLFLPKDLSLLENGKEERHRNLQNRISAYSS